MSGTLGTLLPTAIQQFVDENGEPYVGGMLYSFIAGTETPTPLYKDPTLTQPHLNPIVLDAAGRPGVVYLNALSYKLRLKNAAGVEIWTVDNIAPPLVLRNVQAFSDLTGDQNNVPVPPGVVTYLTFLNQVPLTISGFTGGTAGQLLILRSGQAGRVDLLHMAGLSTEQLWNFAHSGPTTMMPGGSAVYMFQPPLWVLLTHEQGGWIHLPYDANNFYASGDLEDPESSGAFLWDVQPQDALQMDYRLSGTDLQISIAITGASVAANSNWLSLINLPFQWQTITYGLPGTTRNYNGDGVVPVVEYETALVRAYLLERRLLFYRANGNDFGAFPGDHAGVNNKGLNLYAQVNLAVL